MKDDAEDRNGDKITFNEDDICFDDIVNCSCVAELLPHTHTPPKTIVWSTDMASDTAHSMHADLLFQTLKRTTWPFLADVSVGTILESRWLDPDVSVGKADLLAWLSRPLDPSSQTWEWVEFSKADDLILSVAVTIRDLALQKLLNNAVGRFPKWHPLQM